VQIGVVEPADGTVYLSLTFRPNARGCAKRRWWASLGARPQTTQGCDATYLQCSLSRRRMVFAATPRRRAGLISGTIGLVLGASVKAGKGAARSVDELSADAASNAASLHWKPTSTS
jgi:hypothetical protein